MNNDENPFKQSSQQLLILQGLMHPCCNAALTADTFEGQCVARKLGRMFAISRAMTHLCGWAGMQEGSMESTSRRASSDSPQRRLASECSELRSQQHQSLAADPTIAERRIGVDSPASATHGTVPSQQDVPTMSPKAVPLPQRAVRGQASAAARAQHPKPAGQRPLLLQPDRKPTPKSHKQGAD